MKKIPVALQLYSVREDMKADFRGTLEKVKEMGYDGVEFAGLFEKTGEEVKAICEKVGITPISAHVPYKSMIEDLSLIETYATIGCKYIAIPSLRNETFVGGELYEEVKEGIKKIAAKAKEFGITLLYHNHDFEFEKLDGEYKLDILYSDLSADVLQTQLDTCWVNIGGEVPADYIIKYAGRTPVVHLKDFVGSKAENMYGLISEEGSENKKAETEKFDFRPVGYGVQDFKAILAASEKAGAEWVVVEMDKPALDKTPMECAKMSIDYLKTIN